MQGKDSVVVHFDRNGLVESFTPHPADLEQLLREYLLSFSRVYNRERQGVIRAAVTRNIPPEDEEVIDV